MNCLLNLGESFCGKNNGGCTHLCLPMPRTPGATEKYRCACPDGTTLNSDKRSCMFTGKKVINVTFSSAKFYLNYCMYYQHVKR